MPKAEQETEQETRDPLQYLEAVYDTVLSQFKATARIMIPLESKVLWGNQDQTAEPIKGALAISTRNVVLALALARVKPDNNLELKFSCRPNLTLSLAQIKELAASAPPSFQTVREHLGSPTGFFCGVIGQHPQTMQMHVEGWVNKRRYGGIDTLGSEKNKEIFGKNDLKKGVKIVGRYMEQAALIAKSPIFRS